MWNKAHTYSHPLLISGLKFCSLCKAVWVEIMRSVFSAEKQNLAIHPFTLPPFPIDKPLPKLFPSGYSTLRWCSSEIKCLIDCICNGMECAKTIYNFEIVTELFSYVLLGDHRKTPKTPPVCFKCSFISDITNLLFLKPRVSNIFSGGETYQLKCLAFWGSLLLGLFFFPPTLSNLMSPPSFCFAFPAGVCCFQREYFGFPLLTCAHVSVAPCPCPFQEC